MTLVKALPMCRSTTFAYMGLAGAPAGTVIRKISKREQPSGFVSAGSAAAIFQGLSPAVW